MVVGDQQHEDKLAAGLLVDFLRDQAIERKNYR